MLSEPFVALLFITETSHAWAGALQLLSGLLFCLGIRTRGNRVALKDNRTEIDSFGERVWMSNSRGEL
jgi:hypothetical protein